MASAARDVGQDVTDQLGEAIPAMGNVLTAIGDGVASSQQALDQGVIDTVKTLNDTKITVVTQVVEHLTDDGLPDGSQTEIVTNDLSVLNFFMPTFHEWKNVSVCLDMMIGSFHQDQGLQFSQIQHSKASAGGGLFWGFIGWSSNTESTIQTDYARSSTEEVRWKQGQIQVDGWLGPRTTGKFPVPASVAIGPQIFVTQGPIAEKKTGDVVTSRSINLQIDIRKADGSANPGKSITLNSAGLLPNFPDGNLTDAEGHVKVTLTRSLVPGFNAYRTYQVAVSLGQLRKTAPIIL